jgi:hypothetical protein
MDIARESFFCSVSSKNALTLFPIRESVSDCEPNEKYHGVHYSGPLPAGQYKRTDNHQLFLVIVKKVVGKKG